VTVRLFVALPLDGPTLEGLAAVTDRLTPVAGRVVRWARSEGRHLTLKFLGDTDLTLRAALGESLAEVAARAARLTLQVSGLGTFPPRGAPRIIWAGLETDGEGLSTLARSVERAMVELGFPPERRPFRAHVTLGRVRPRTRVPGALRGQIEEEGRRLHLAPFLADAMVLFRSHLEPSGARYEILQRWPLGGRGSTGAP
jgi:2'-5' RNA ligase